MLNVEQKFAIYMWVYVCIYILRASFFASINLGFREIIKKFITYLLATYLYKPNRN